MPTAEQRDDYRRRAATVRDAAKVEADPDMRAALEQMAESYDRLVAEIDRIEHIRRAIGKLSPDPGNSAA